MKIQMIRSRLGSNDGATTQHYEKDEEYEVSEGLGRTFVEEGVAKEVGDVDGPAYEVGSVYNIDDATFLAVLNPGDTEPTLKPVEELSDEQRTALIAEGKLAEDGTAIDQKAVEGAPKNKAIGRAPKNKAK